MWKSENGLNYSLLHISTDPRPQWIKLLGIHATIINGVVIERHYPRLRYKRKIGSHVVNPHAEESYKTKEEDRYKEYLDSLLLTYNMEMSNVFSRKKD